MTNLIQTQNGQRPGNLGGMVDQLISKPFDVFFDDAFWGLKPVGRGNQLPVNIRQFDNAYEIQFAAPGLSRNAFDIRLEGTTLTVSLEEKEKEQEDNEASSNAKWITREFQPQPSSRAFTVDDTIDTAAITAKYLEGILYLTLPMKEQARPVNRQINIE
jgi:HSP20 family protein